MFGVIRMLERRILVIRSLDPTFRRLRFVTGTEVSPSAGSPSFRFG